MSTFSAPVAIMAERAGPGMEGCFLQWQKLDWPRGK
jgi:hypothetical protein